MILILNCLVPLLIEHDNYIDLVDFKLKNIDIAKGKLIHLNREYPDNIEIALKLAEVYYTLNDKEKEKLVIKNLVKSNPDALNDRRVRKYSKN